MAARPFSDRWNVVSHNGRGGNQRDRAAGYEDAQAKARILKRDHPDAVVWVEHVCTYHTEPLECAPPSTERGTS